MTASVPRSGADGKQVNRAEIIDKNFIEWVRSLKVFSKNKPLDKNHYTHFLNRKSQLTQKDFLELFESQMASRQLDLMARRLRLEDKVFYTIGSSGHEGNALLGRLLRHTDPAFVHYRSGAFMAERSRKLPDIDFIYATALSLTVSQNDPVSGGRHKVWGSKPLWVLPQTSTIASHLPKAVGTAIAIAHAKAVKVQLPVPADSIVLCSFGDASVNHSTAQGAFNAAQWTAFQWLHVPILFVCEDNGLGISVPTPPDWIEANFKNRPGLTYFQANGLDLSEGYNTVKQAIDHCRQYRKPVFLHLKTTRLLGHAGTDFEIVYRDRSELEAAEAQDPLLMSAKIAVENGIMTPAMILDRYETLRVQCMEAAAKADATPHLISLEEIIKPLAPFNPEAVQTEATRHNDQQERLRIFGSEEALPENLPPRHLAIQINRGLTDLLIKYKEALIFGEDVAKKGGVYTVTSGLTRLFKNSRVFNTLLDEQTILGLAQGYANMGMLPIPEIQYLAYYHNASDQIRGEAASLQFFSNNQFQNPMVVRIASLGYQKGFGGHFHNDNSIAALRDIPSLIVACPCRGDDAVMMLRTLMAMAKINGRVSVFLEPIALYMTKDLYENGDNLWLFDYPQLGLAIPFGKGRVYFPEAQDLLIITYGNCVPMSLQAAKKIEKQTNKKVRILDLRWLQPLNEHQIIEHATACDRVLIVDEGRKTGSISEGIITALVEHQSKTRNNSLIIKRVVGEDSYTTLGPSANVILPSVDSITSAVLSLLATDY